mgnify:CR=1 FL=1
MIELSAYAVIVAVNPTKYNVRLVKFLLKPAVFRLKERVLCYDSAAGVASRGKTWAITTTNATWKNMLR